MRDSEAIPRGSASGRSLLMNPLQEYFKSIADELDAKYRQANVGNHKGDRGTNRESALLGVLNNHLPERLKAELGGQILGLSGSISKQVDIIIRNDLAIRFNQLDRSFVLLEGVAAVISVKSYLDKDALFDCLDNFASIPQFKECVVKFPLVERPVSFINYARFTYNYPRCFIFAYDGLSPETLLEHISEYLRTKPPLPGNRFPKLIVVNRKSTIYPPFEGVGKTLDGRDIPPNHFLSDNLTPEMYGYPFTYILHELSKYLTWLPHLQLDFSQYFLENFNPNLNEKNK